MMDGYTSTEWGGLMQAGQLAGTDAAAAARLCVQLLADRQMSEGTMGLMADVLDMDAQDWALTALYFYELVQNARIADMEQYHTACRALGRSGASPLPAALRWGPGGVELSPVCRDFLLMRSPELPPCAELVLCKSQPVCHGDAILEELTAFLQQYARQPELGPAAVLLWGEEGSGRGFLLRETAARLGGALLMLHPQAASRADARELVLAAMLYRAFPMIRGYSARDEWLLRLLEEGAPVVLLTATAPAPVAGRLLMQRQVPPLTPAERACSMEMLFPQSQWGPETRQLLERSHLTAAGLWQTAARCRAEEVLAPGGQAGPEVLARLVQQEDAPEFSGGAQLLHTDKHLADVILPPEQQQMLQAICTFAKDSRRIYSEWGFAGKVPYGRGVSALFYGASGTGKTLAATALANELGLPLYRVDLAQLTSKYVGETQKNIGRIFAQAQKAGCVLFFDEADALFSRRAEVTDAQDKYANGEIAYLLQQTEQYEGVTLLATNLLQNFDEAFRRRITFMVRFPMPDAAQRERLWRSIWPAEAPLDPIDYPFLARQFELSGAGIRNCAVYAAFLAMQQQGRIGMHEIMQAIKNEYDKLGKTVDPQWMQMF